MNWWKQITALGLISLLGGSLWKYRQLVLEYAMFFRGFKKRFEETEKAVMNPRSPEARVCPECDQRMSVIQARFDTWWYKCADCDKTFPYPAPGVKRPTR